ncbi:pyridoxal phosphate-dependent aminotransferase [Orrella sp. NBD-18]|uniref:Aminotransferase n=1 Tax=Sheuella amnicola TaxID=2707330 RepID=A0A6B2QZ32_9BURK|nr:pyridoxal phosphate-dependent aminotransferase [Sheuella amnicola]NDY82968.1 pyridoxal phosphate-dependent aminotransferase [Sheuella amnicola]
MIALAARTRETATFHAVELMKQANDLKRAGIDIISLGVGEPDFTAPPPVLAAMQSAAHAGLSGYSSPAGIAQLREAISGYYANQLHANVDPSRIIVTSGASGALLLAAMALINPGDEVLMPDPYYPANRNFIGAAGGITRLIPTTAQNRFQLSAGDIEQHWNSRTKGVLIASPGNPTGTSLTREELDKVLKTVRAKSGFVIMDEIYLGLSYESERQTALTLDDDVIIINSFSKYFNMTGWRLGWMVVPPYMVEPIEKMAASLAICAPTLAQYGAVACFEPESIAIYEQRREAFRQRRDYLVPALEALNIKVPVKPDGAFYIYADVSAHTPDSNVLSTSLLHNARVAVVPGVDFGPAHANSMMRFAYTIGLDRLQEAIHRIKTYLG